MIYGKNEQALKLSFRFALKGPFLLLMWIRNGKTEVELKRACKVSFKVAIDGPLPNRWTKVKVAIQFSMAKLKRPYAGLNGKT